MIRAAAIAALLVAAPLAAATESWTGCDLVETGLLKADLTLVYAVDATATADPGYTIDEIGTSGVYFIDGFPSPDAGHDYFVSLAPTAGGGGCYHFWPSPGNGPQPFIYAPEVVLPPGSDRIVVGDTLPAFSPRVEGFASDPTGATVTVTFYAYATGTVTALADLPATLVSATSYRTVPDGRLAWRVTLSYAWSATDTTTLGAGRYYARFTLTLPVANCGPDEDETCTLTVPGLKEAPVTVIP